MTKNLSDFECFALLGNRQRLLLLGVLNDSYATSLSMRELAKRIAECAYEDPSAQDLRDTRLALYHNHVPRLEEADVVSYDRDDDTVEAGPNFDALVPFLAQTSEREISRSET